MSPAPKQQISGFDAVLVGGGLQNALIALALLARRPDARIALVERGTRIGGNHTWSFHAGDVPEAARPFVEPLVVQHWAGYDVAFPDFDRTVSGRYASISSERLAGVVEAAFAASPGSELLTSATAAQVGPSRVTLSDGRVLLGDVVIDARGPDRFASPRAVGFQKFVGLELELAGALAPARPLLMDARVPQTDGFRFFYVLPFAPDRVLVEDTMFSDTPDLDVERIRDGILEYAKRAGLVPLRVVREEIGVLPMPTRGLSSKPIASPIDAGYAGGWFHPTTAYSFPIALRLALAVAEVPPGESLADALEPLARQQRRQFRFGAFLNRLLFGAFAPESRWNVLARFYRLPEGTIHRFYSLETTTSDRLRILCGRPPRGMSFTPKALRSALA